MPSGADLKRRHHADGLLQKSQLSLGSTDGGRQKSLFVEELDQRNERRSRMTIGGTGGVVVVGQSLMRPRGAGVPPRDDDAVDATGVMESTTQGAKGEQHVSSERADR
jgi:hypothetical protein